MLTWCVVGGAAAVGCLLLRLGLRGHSALWVGTSSMLEEVRPLSGVPQAGQPAPFVVPDGQLLDTRSARLGVLRSLHATLADCARVPVTPTLDSARQVAWGHEFCWPPCVAKLAADGYIDWSLTDPTQPQEGAAQ